jgi:CheY-like chemotaxis protein
MDGMTATRSAAQSSGVIMPGLAGVKVLLVEDEWLVAMLVEELLGEIGCEVGGVAASVAEAQSRIESGVEFDVAILDVNLGGEKSFPVAEALMARHRPFMFATGFGPADIAQRFPGVSLLLKPYSARTLAKSLENLISR